MEFTLFVLRGIGYAMLVAVIGTLAVALVEIGVAYRNPERRSAMRERSWRQNLYHMWH